MKLTPFRRLAGIFRPAGKRILRFSLRGSMIVSMRLRQLFLPTDTNDYTPHLLQRFALLGMTTLILLTFTMVNLQTLIWQASDWLVGAILPAVVVDLTNEERTAAALLPLTRSAALDEAARLKAEHMAEQGYFAHYSPAGVTPWHWFAEAGYTFVHAGENLAIHFSDSSQVVEAWMQSPTHRDNIVSAKYREIGVGTARGTYQGFDTIFVVQLFGTPAVPPVPVAQAAPPTPVPTLAAAPAAELPATEPAALVAADDTESQQVAGTESPAEVLIEEETIIALEDTAAPVVTLPPPTEVESPAPAVVLETEATTPVGDTEIAEVLVAEELISVYSGFTSSSTDLAPASISASLDANGGTTAPMLARVATQPNLVLQYVYILLASLIGIALFASVLIEWRHQRPVQVAYGVALLLIMTGLYYTHLVVTSGAVVV